MTLFGLNKSEFRQISLILAAIIVITLLNLRVAYRKGRDAQRKSDIRSIYDVLMLYQAETGSLPLSTSDGKIILCQGYIDAEKVAHFEPCRWYQDPFINLFAPDQAPYLKVIPGDPCQGQGRSYFYISNGSHFQLYASLESSSEPEFDPAIEARNLPCGQYLCNFGRSDGKTPLDKALEEYENELLLDAQK